MTRFDDNKILTLAALGQPDKSRAGTVDPQIVPVLEAINSTADFYTTSSCAGRYLLIGFTGSTKKRDAQWLYVDHDTIAVTSIRKTLVSIPEDTQTIWYRCEPPILHVCARNISCAQYFLDAVRSTGLKRSGIISIRDDKIMIEIIGTITLAFPLWKKEKSVDLSDAFLQEVISQSQTLLCENRELFNNIIELCEQFNN